MNTVPQTERQVVNEEVGFLSREFYEQQLSTLSFNALKEECLRQYDISGETLDRYRAAYQRAQDALKRVDNLQMEVSKLRQTAIALDRVGRGFIIAANHVIGNLQTAASYTHSMKRTTWKLCEDILEKAKTGATWEIKHAEKALDIDLDTDDEIPF